MQWEGVLTYLFFGLGGILSSMEWWCWETMSAITPLSVHTVPTQIIQVVVIIPFGISIALSICMGATLPYLVFHAAWLTVGSYIFDILIMIVICTMLHVWRFLFYALFTKLRRLLRGV
mmetsp:Transcript_18671/g.28404  ORF Transcript_18671/g.28404 Transcript_18671/m.28404 type:complete len:118 (+) Transcript_18671:340-693(+)